MTKRLRILVDMDGVVAKFNDAIADEWDKLYPNYPAIRDGRLWRTDENYSQVYGKWSSEAVINIYYKKGFFLNLAPYPGAVDALKAMKAAGHDVFFCTSPVSQYEYCTVEKYQWVEKLFGLDWTKQIILTRDKTIISADYLIDDKPNITGLCNPPLWKQVLYNQSYNRDSNLPRIVSWNDWENVLI